MSEFFLTKKGIAKKISLIFHHVLYVERHDKKSHFSKRQEIFINPLPETPIRP